MRNKCLESPVKEFKLFFAAIQTIIKEQLGAEGPIFYNFPRGRGLGYWITAQDFHIQSC